MNEQNGGFIENGSVISPRHFIYLDRSRLFSYTAQLSDGLPHLRSFLESVGHSTSDSSIEQYGEEVNEDTGDGEGSGNLGVITVKGKKGHKSSHKEGFKDGGSTNKYDSLQILSQDKIEHDNLYLALEEDLASAGWLKELDESALLDRLPTLIKVKGVARFFDWESIMQLFEKPDAIWSFFSEEVRRNLGGNQGKNSLKNLSQIIRTFSIGHVTTHMQVGNLNLTASLNPKHLCMTLEQLRAGYAMPGDVEVTLVGFAPRRSTEQVNFPGFAGQLDMREIWSSLAGQIDLVVDPLAIYGETLSL